MTILTSGRRVELMKARLRSEWKKEAVLEGVRSWCNRNNCSWRVELEHKKREELIKLFLKPTGNFGGVGIGHNLLYVNQTPLMELDEKKCERYFKPEELDPSLKLPSKGHTWMNARKSPEKEIRPGKNKQGKGSTAKAPHVSGGTSGEKQRQRKNQQTRDPLMGTGHASFGGSKRQPAYPKYEGPYDPEKAAELLARKFGDKVRRLK